MRRVTVWCAKAAFVVAIVGLVLMALPGTTSRTSAQQFEPFRFRGPVVKGRILVKFRSETTENEVAELIADRGGREQRELAGTRIRVVEVPDGTDEDAVVESLQSQAGVEFAELDRAIPPSQMVPNDPDYAYEWHLPKINAPGAWATNTGSSGVIIAILDTGVDSTHPELASKIVPGWNAYDNNDDTSDVYGHGTMVAGTAAASSNNTVGVASVAWGCQIMPIRISDLAGYAYYSSIAAGLTWAADHGARVANISYEATGSLTVSTAAQYFRSRGGVIVVAAGNGGILDTASPDNPDVLTVSATTTTDTLASWSNRGNKIDLSAPGVSIRTTVSGGGYGSYMGTSFSAPVVSGVAALVISANPSLTSDQIQEVVKMSSDDLGSAGWDTSFGWGRVNAYNAVMLATGTPPPSSGPTVAITSPANGASVSGNVSVTVNVTAAGPIEKVELYVDGVLKSSAKRTPYTNTWNSRRSPGSHALMCKIYDRAGNVGTSATVNVVVGQ
jgi:subtilisin family serine protease